MSDTLKQDQKGGDNSTNVQAQTVNITGMTVTEARQLALDVFKANALELAGVARDLFESRGREFIDRYLEELQRRKPGCLGALQEPDMQQALFTAQKAYACSGREDLEQVLIDLLVERTTATSLRRIVLNEAISKASVLTSTQLDALSALLLLRFRSPLRFRFTTLDDFTKYLRRHLSPLFHADTAEVTTWSHLIYTGCVSSVPNSGPLTYLFLIRTAFQTCFAEGCDQSEIEPSCSVLKDLFVPSFHADSAFQMPMDRLSFVEICRERGLSEEQNSVIWNSLCKRYLSDSRISDILLQVDLRFETICKSPYPAPRVAGIAELSPVGVALANANLRRASGMEFDLGIWIK